MAIIHQALSHNVRIVMYLLLLLLLHIRNPIILQSKKMEKKYTVD